MTAEHDMRRPTYAQTRRLSGGAQPRRSAAFLTIVDRIHDLVADLAPRPGDLQSFVEFLTEVGHAAEARRQEWVLLAVTRGSRFGLTQVRFVHPWGIGHELIENPADVCPPIMNAAQGTMSQTAIKGNYSMGVAVHDLSSMDEFLMGGLKLTLESRSDDGLMYSAPERLGLHSVVEVVPDKTGKQGTRMLAGGTIDHMVLNTGN